MPTCTYGSECYRKNANHIKECHPEKLKTKPKITQFFDTSEKAERKRKSDDTQPSKDEPKTKYFAPRTEKKKEILKENTPCTEESEFYQINADIKVFWKYANTLNRSKPLEAFSKLHMARLVGVFEYMNGDLQTLSVIRLIFVFLNEKIEEDDLMLHYRYATDFPEMETFLVTANGSYAFWRDDPDDKKNYLIVFTPHNSTHFVKIEVIGDSVWHSLVHLAGRDHVSKWMPKEMKMDEVKKKMRNAQNLRMKKKLGSLPHQPGIHVHVVNDVGYREIAESPAKLKKNLEIIGTTDDEYLKEKKMEAIMEIVAYVQFANDECDFGMGLELGHWLWSANYEALDDLAANTLIMAYKLLERTKYERIVTLLMEKGRRRPSYDQLEQ